MSEPARAERQPSNSEGSQDGQRFDLEEDEELRILCDNGTTDAAGYEVELVKGFGEIFGSEMQRERRYMFTSNVSIFTFSGCSLQVFGDGAKSTTKTKKTPALMYLNVHASLEQFRKNADSSSASEQPEETWTKGPNVLVTGPTDVGKTTLCKTLLNYAVRMGRRPVYVDLDVGQGSISVPGFLGAVVVEDVSDIECKKTHLASPALSSFNFFHLQLATFSKGLHLCTITDTRRQATTPNCIAA